MGDLFAGYVGSAQDEQADGQEGKGDGPEGGFLVPAHQQPVLPHHQLELGQITGTGHFYAFSGTTPLLQGGIRYQGFVLALGMS